MNSCPKRRFYPAQVFAQFTSMGEKSANHVEGRQTESNTLRVDKEKMVPDIIQVFETGEMSMGPDYAQVVIICSNVKDSAEEVKSSVNKRVGYILQTFRSHGVTKSSYSVDRCLTRKDANYHFRVEITIQYVDFTKCQELSNFLVEKLDDSVEVSRPSFHYLPGKLESLRRQSCVLAVHNARVKAIEMASALNQSLGPAKQICEESIEEFVGKDVESKRTEGSETFQEMVKLATTTVVTKVFALFELKGKAKKRLK